MDQIFVAIAAYRDPELVPTIRDLYAKANHPERVVVGVCFQSVPGVDDGLLAPVPYPTNVHIESWNASDSKGAVWAKGRAHKLRRGEAYTLMVDAHMRFAAGFDDALIAMLAECDSPKPVLSTYPSPYHPAVNGQRERVEYSTPHLVANTFGDDSIPRLLAQERKFKRPARNAFISGGYVFARSALFEDVPLDMRVFFSGEEITFSARAFTHGWDAFTPSACLCAHFYGRSRAPKVWTDNRDWSALNDVSVRRVKHLLGIEPTTDAAALVDLDRYGLGSHRTLAEYERFAGIDMRARTVTDAAKRGEYGL